MMKKRLAILLSGRGSNFVAIADAVERGDLDAEIAVVISNRAGAAGIKLARGRGLTAVELPPQRKMKREDYDELLIAELAKYDVDLIILAGFMRILSNKFVRKFPQKILNIHPSLLPAFPGLDVHQVSLDWGVKVSGCTVHFVDEGLDSGPIVKQATVPVLDDDTAETLAARILKEEHKIYTEAIKVVLSGNFQIEGRRVIETPDAE